MSRLFNYEASGAAEHYDRERCAAGADIITGLMHVHGGKQIQDLHVLDAGCGTGLYSKALIDLGVGKFTILDCSSAMLNVATEKLKPYIDSKIVDDVIQTKLPDLPFAAGTFDAVMLLLVLHHLDKSDCVKTIQAAKEVLRSKGLVFVTTVLLSTCKDAVWFTQIHPKFKEKLSNFHMTAKEHVALFTEQGFECVTAMNLLNRATPSILLNYFDHEGPLRREWRNTTGVFEIAGNQLIEEMEMKFLDLKNIGALKQYMDDHDHTDETGFLTLFVFKLTE